MAASLPARQARLLCFLSTAHSFHVSLPFSAFLPGCCSIPYVLEVMKGGAMLDTVQLAGRDHFTLGRAPTNDIVMDHPSSSRCGHPPALPAPPAAIAQPGLLVHWGP